jgi:hypothetical protein
VPAASWALDLSACPTYGPQHTTIAVTFEAGATEYAVELLPEEAQESPDTITVYRFTPEQSRRTYSYVASSPFHGGYRWREYRAAPPLTDWALASPAMPLELVASASPATSGGVIA